MIYLQENQEARIANPRQLFEIEAILSQKLITS